MIIHMAKVKITNWTIIISLTFSFISCIKKDLDSLLVPSVFSDHMVLQQQVDVPFWGTSKANHEVTVSGSWGISATSKANEKGEWDLSLNTPVAGGPYTVTIKSYDEEIKFKNVLIGEVWLASGQSNMEYKLDHCIECIDNQKVEIASANYPDIRMFTVPMDLSGEAIKNESWLITNPKNVKKFSAVAYFFARHLHEKLKVPIGIINSSWGGTRVEAWISHNKLLNLDLTKNRIPDIDDYDSLKNEFLRLNDSINNLNEKDFGFQTYQVPSIWTDFNIGDLRFKDVDFDDSSWPYWNPKHHSNENEKVNEGRFESVFDEIDASLLSDAVIWFRTEVMINDINDDYHINITRGIDDVDQTYFNGILIGNESDWSLERDYKIPKKILKKGKNTLAIRVTDLGGPGGFNSPVLLKSSLEIRELPLRSFKYRHEAFITTQRSFIVKHNYSADELIQKTQQINDKLREGYLIDDPNAYSMQFDKMLNPILPYGIKGAIWYQGEANVVNYNEYQELFTGMIEDWRDHWGYDFSFYYAQIAPFDYAEKSERSHELRDTQRKSLKVVSNTGMATLLDIGEKDDIHPANKQDVGKRLALLALDNDYNFDLVSSGPLYKNHVIFNDYIQVDFENIGSGLVSRGILKDFEIAGADSIFLAAKAEIVNNKVRVWSNKVSEPIHVRYGWKNWMVGTLFNKEKLPASSFNSINGN